MKKKALTRKSNSMIILDMLVSAIRYVKNNKIYKSPEFSIFRDWFNCRREIISFEWVCRD